MSYHNLNICFSLILAGLICGPGCDRQDSVPSDTQQEQVRNEPAKQEIVPQSKTKYPDWDGLTFHLTGADLEKAPNVVVLMHGFGAAGHDLLPLGMALTVNDSTCFVLPEAPLQIPEGGRAWFKKPDDYLPAREKLLKLLEFVKRQNSQARITLGGFSQGAMLASNFLEKDSHLFAALVLLSPSGELREELTGQASHKPTVFLSHGRTDPVLPFKGSESLQKKLVDFEYEVDWIPFDGGHSIPPTVLTELLQFMARVRSD